MPLPLRVAIAGVGAFGREHARVVRRLATLAAVADPSPSARATFAGAPAYASMGELLRRERVDVVHVCTPTGTHEEVGAEALGAGCHLFAEKPFAETAAGAEWLVRLAEARGVRVCAGHQLLYEPAARRAFDEMGRIGALVHAESFYSCAPGADLGELLLHPLYVLLHALETAAPGEDAELDALHVSPAGTVHALLRRGHAAGTLVVSAEGRPAESFLRLVGTRGTVTADFVRGTVQRLMGPGSSAVSKAA
ncbi:MAG: Gfo/Idh/MocA family oxidoreductase, partial [Gemmatimonadetes bacterium]|nr:Gfo/Idh/MocA family oxidoreductase [Gemmatimonadota bacterium]